MKDIIVNWVKEDEELLEPYEWDEDDDLEIISVVEPESLATKPLPWMSSFGFALDAINDEFSRILLPYIFGSKNGTNALVTVS